MLKPTVHWLHCDIYTLDSQTRLFEIPSATYMLFSSSSLAISNCQAGFIKLCDTQHCRNHLTTLCIIPIIEVSLRHRLEFAAQPPIYISHLPRKDSIFSITARYPIPSSSKMALIISDYTAFHDTSTNCAKLHYAKLYTTLCSLVGQCYLISSSWIIRCSC